VWRANFDVLGEIAYPARWEAVPVSHTLIFPLSRLRTDQVDAVRQETARSVPRFFRTSVIALLVAISYYVGSQIGFFFAPHHALVATYWPANAILLAAFLLTPPRMWWIFLVTVLPVHFLLHLGTHMPLSVVLGKFVGNTGEALLGAVCIRRFAKPRVLFDSAEGVFVFFVFGVFLAPFVTSFLDAAVVVFSGVGRHYWELWTSRLFSNMLAALTIAPTITIFAVCGNSWVQKANLKKLIEAGLLAVAVVFVSVLVFGRQGGSGMPALIYAPLLVWAAVRFGPGGLSASMLVVALISIWNALHGRGPFAALSDADHVLSLHILLIIFALPLMLTAALIAERRRSEETLTATRRKLVDAHEQERHRIARELHDGIVQQITLVGLSLDDLRSGFIALAKPALDQLYDQISGVSEAARKLSHHLHPFTVEYLGLARALKKLCRDTGAKGSLTINFSEKDLPSQLPSDVSYCLFRVAQESLQNIAQHSHARTASMELKVRGGHALLRIADDGVGITPEQHHSGGMGLASMRERVWALDGTCRVMSEPLKGTTVEASVPLKEEPQASGKT
jgi:signal transduction histidine kinase